MNAPAVAADTLAPLPADDAVLFSSDLRGLFGGTGLVLWRVATRRPVAP